MRHHFITELLGIKDRHIEVWHIQEEEGGLLVELGTKVRTQTCPSCRKRTRRVHGYRNQPLQGPLLSQTRVQLLLRKRRYRCLHCRHTFYEQLQLVDPYQRCTTSLQTTALTYAALGSFTTAARLAGMTTNRLIRLFDKRQVKTRQVLPRAIAMDEFKGDAGGERFQTNVVDVENREVIEILPDRKAETVKAYLRSRYTSQVEIVVMDLSKSFKQAVRQVLEDPLIIADRFHYMRQVYWALEEVRRKVQRDLEKKTRIRMKRGKKLLWKSPSKLSKEERQRLEELLRVDPRLREAYALKNEMDRWFKESDHQTAKKGLEACLQEMKGSSLGAFHRVRKTFRNWQQEILQSFMYPFNDGYIEGVNNTIKVLKRTSYGIKDFDRMRNKMLWQQKIKQVL